MTDLGLDQLTDDQLVELVKAGLREIARRDPTVQTVAAQMVLDERERLALMRDAGNATVAAVRNSLRQEAEAMAREDAQARVLEARFKAERELQIERARLQAERERRELVPQIEIAAAIHVTFGKGWTVEQYRKNGDTRLYMSGPDCDWQSGRYGSKKIGQYIEYYLTGTENGKYSAGQIIIPKSVVINRSFAKRLCEHCLTINFKKIICDDMLDDADTTLPSWYEGLKNGK